MDCGTVRDNSRMKMFEEQSIVRLIDFQLAIYQGNGGLVRCDYDYNRAVQRSKFSYIYFKLKKTHPSCGEPIHP